ncbi:MAG: hypothetical protein HY736_01530 [Verrucomicrobia bacterium]|nr:hypothetical protein [Verrucomicrobiota bacterium]
MILRREFRAALAVLLATCLACPPARALVTFNDSHDRIFVNGSFGVSGDSNIFANSDNEGDLVYSSGFSLEYVRRAGWIGVNAGMSAGASWFGKNKSQNFSNPSYNLELTKQSGRTTGAFTVSGARESRADAAVNLRSTSWNYNTGLNVKYPAGNYTFSGNLGYSSRKYVDETFFANLATYNAALDVFRILPSERELIGGYRYRYSETSRNSSSTDHSLNVGVSGKLIRGVIGSLRGGLQARIPRGGLPGEGKYSSWTASGSSHYAVSKKINLSGSISKDYSTTATSSSVDVISASVSTAYAFNSRWALSGSAGWGDTRFLGEGGRIVLAAGPPPVLGPFRHDNYANWNVALSYSLNEHFKSGISYGWFQNWSTLSFADFVRTSWALNLSSRW